MKTTNCLGYRVVCLHSEVDSTITYLFVGFNYNIKNSIIITTHECWRRNYLCFSFFFIALIILGAQIWGVQTRCRIADFGLNPTGTTTWWRDLKMCCRGVIFRCGDNVMVRFYSNVVTTPIALTVGFLGAFMTGNSELFPVINK